MYAILRDLKLLYTDTEKLQGSQVMQVRNEAMPWLAEQTEYAGLSLRENCEELLH